MTANTSTAITVTTPAGSVGSVDVYVVTAGGPSNTLTSAYKYIAAPSISTDAASAITASSAQLNGSVRAGGDTTTVTICYGTASDLSGCSTVTASGSPVTGNDTTTVTYQLSGLNNATTYRYRVIGSNTLGTTNGKIGRAHV